MSSGRRVWWVKAWVQASAVPDPPGLLVAVAATGELLLAVDGELQVYRKAQR